DALSKLPGDCWRLMVVGSLTMNAAYSRRIRDQIGRAGLTGCIELIGAIPNEDVPEYITRNHILAVPSRYEAFGMAYLEAMSLGLPVIATTAGGAHEIVADGETGFLIAPGDSIRLAECFKELERNRERLLEMGIAAYLRVRGHPTWDQSLASIREFLQSMVEQGSGSKAYSGGLTA
ncbi:MAG TPA: glycosyltransferase family 4 protein, partial [Blastocatellia bacterium]|nr:glycosyltransferase family 4 protein [Blastocatellia bacterium]